MAPKESAGLLINKKDGRLYFNKQNKSLSVCGPVDNQLSSAENAVTVHLRVAVEQIQKWNDNLQAEIDQKITSHIIMFPYHITAHHWALGTLELKLDRKALQRAEVKIYNPLPSCGGNKVSNEAYDNIVALLKDFFRDPNIQLTSIDSNHQQQQAEDDGVSCGVIVAENGRWFLGIDSVSNNILAERYKVGVRNLRYEHAEVICRVDFSEAQSRPPARISPYCKPLNYCELYVDFVVSINLLENELRTEILNIIQDWGATKGDQPTITGEDIATRIRDWIRFQQDQNNFKEIVSNLFDTENSTDWKFKGDHINTLKYIIEEFFNNLLCKDLGIGVSLRLDPVPAVKSQRLGGQGVDTGDQNRKRKLGEFGGRQKKKAKSQGIPETEEQKKQAKRRGAYIYQLIRKVKKADDSRYKSDKKILETARNAAFAVFQIQTEILPGDTNIFNYKGKVGEGAGRWLQEAVRLQHPSACYMLQGYKYYYGWPLEKGVLEEVVLKNDLGAFNWFKFVADSLGSDQRQARYMVGYMYYNGLGVGKDFDEAYKYFSLATSAERSEADLVNKKYHDEVASSIHKSAAFMCGQLEQQQRARQTLMRNLSISSPEAEAKRKEPEENDNQLSFPIRSSPGKSSLKDSAGKGLVDTSEPEDFEEFVEKLLNNIG